MSTRIISAPSGSGRCNSSARKYSRYVVPTRFPASMSTRETTAQLKSRYFGSVGRKGGSFSSFVTGGSGGSFASRSEEHTSELQSRFDLVCRLLLEKKQ